MGSFNFKSRKASVYLQPKNVTPPLLTGLAKEGQTLTFVNGVWNNSPTSYNRYVYRDDGTLLATNAATYVPTAADVGHTLVPAEQATNTYGSVFAYGSTTAIVASSEFTTFPATQTINFRNRTLAGHGGHDLGYVGTATVWIESGNTGNVWTIDANKHLVIVGSYGTTPAVAPSGSYSLVITDGTYSTTATVNVVDYGFTVRPTPPSASGLQLQTAIQNTALRFGDCIDMRPGVYNPAETRITCRRTTPISQRTVPTTGPAAPTQPYHEWITDISAKDGWVTIQPEIAGTVELRFIELAIETYQDWYLRFTGLILRRLKPTGSYTLGGSIYVNSFNGIKQYGYLQFDNLDCLSSGRPDCKVSTNQNHSLFFFDNYFDQGQLTCYASDSWIIGNEMENVGSSSDCIRHSMFKETRDCFLAFNFLHNKIRGTSNQHADGVQGDWSGGNAPNLISGDYEGYYGIGNIIVSADDPGTGTYDMQGIFDGDTISTARLKIIHVGEIIATTRFGNGITQSNAINSIFANCTLIHDQTTSTGSPPRVRMDNEGSACDYITIKNCVAGTTPSLPDTSLDSVTGLPNHQPMGPIPNLTQTNNIWTAGYSSASTYYAAPVYGASLQTIEDVLTAFAPKSGGPLLPGGGAENIGAIGTGYINHLNRTVTVPGVTLPAYVPAYSA